MTTPARQGWLTRMRVLADHAIKVSDGFQALYAEGEIAGFLLPPEHGGLGGDDFQAPHHADMDRETVLAFLATMQSMLGPITIAQKRSLYDVRAPGTPFGPSTFF